jgi:hypothetical protein
MAKKQICKACGHMGKLVRKTRGNLLIEIVLWICFIVPGLIYTIWRCSTRYDVCKGCNATELVLVDSPVGQKLVKEYHGN